MKLTKSQLREMIREEIKSLKENKKSKEASLVLQLMDKDYSYEKALTAVLKTHKNIDRVTLEKELDNIYLNMKLKEILNLNENLSKNFQIGDLVVINSKEPIKKLVGKVGKVVFVNSKKGAVYVDFGKEFASSEDGEMFATHNLDGLIKTNTGLGFYNRGWISSKIDPSFDIRNLTKK